MSGTKCDNINPNRRPIQYAPLAADHDTVCPVCATQNQGCKRISCTREPQLIQGEKRKISLLADGDLTYVMTSQTARGPLRSPSQRVQMRHRSVIGQPVQHQGMPDRFHQI